MRVVIVGIVAGTAASAGFAMLLRKTSFGVDAHDSPVFTVVVAILAIAALAAYLSGQFASKLDPVIIRPE